MKKQKSSALSRKTKGEFIYTVSIILFLGIASIIAIYPFLNVISTSLSSNSAINSGRISWYPIEFTLDSYKKVIADGQIIHSFSNSVIITLVGTLLNMIFTILAAYPLSRKRLMGRSIFLRMITITMVFSGGIIPTYLLVQKLGMLNSYTSLWFPGLIGTFNMFVLKTNFEEIPDALEEAASIDGANDIYIYINENSTARFASNNSDTYSFLCSRFMEFIHECSYVYK